MPRLIYWNVKEAYEFLIQNCYVFTLRKPRTEGEALAVTGSYYDHKPMGMVNVKLILENVYHPHQLSSYVAGSGIKSEITLCDMRDDDAFKWFNLAKNISGEQLNLYLVTMDMRGLYKIPERKQ